MLGLALPLALPLAKTTLLELELALEPWIALALEVGVEAALVVCLVLDSVVGVAVDWDSGVSVLEVLWVEVAVVVLSLLSSLAA